MTMMFRQVKSSVQSILVAAAAGRFRVVGHAGQARGAGEVLGSKRSVQVYFSRGEFDKTANPATIGPFQHDVTLKIEITVSEATKVDLSVLNAEGASSAMLADALFDFQEASALADDSLDELFDIVWNILMDSRNYDLGMLKGRVSGRWVAQLVKDDPLPRGEYVVLTGAMDLTCKVAEEVVGDSPEVGGEYDITIDLEGDDVEKAGVAGTLGGT